MSKDAQKEQWLKLSKLAEQLRLTTRCQANRKVADVAIMAFADNKALELLNAIKVQFQEDNYLSKLARGVREACEAENADAAAEKALELLNAINKQYRGLAGQRNQTTPQLPDRERKVSFEEDGKPVPTDSPQHGNKALIKERFKNACINGDGSQYLSVPVSPVSRRRPEKGGAGTGRF